MKEIVNAYENRLILKQAELDAVGSELLSLQQDCIAKHQYCLRLEKELQDMKRDAFNVALGHNHILAKLKALEEKIGK